MSKSRLKETIQPAIGRPTALGGALWRAVERGTNASTEEWESLPEPTRGCRDRLHSSFARWIDEPQPIVEQKLEAYGQQRNATHDRVAERRAEGDHQEPDSHASGLSDDAFVFKREEEIDQAGKHAKDKNDVLDRIPYIKAAI